MPQVILPCLDEAPALPALLASLPPGWRALVADNGSRDGSADIARAHGATVIDVAQRGYGAAVHAGLRAATSRVVAVMDADGTLDPAQLVRVAAPVVQGDADLVIGCRQAVTRAAYPAYVRVANAILTQRIRARTGLPLRDLGPIRAARRQALLGLGLTDRRYGYPLETVTAAAERGWRIEQVEVDYRPRAAGSSSKVTGTLRGTMRAAWDMSRVLAATTGPAAPDPRPVLVVVAKAPVAGRVKTRLTPRLTADGAAAVARAALADTLAAVRAVPGARAVLALAGDPACLDRSELAGIEVWPQRGESFGERLAHVFGAIPATPMVLVGMDTPQVQPTQLVAALTALADHDAALGRTPDGGWWLLGLRDGRHAETLVDVPMSRPDTGDLTLSALRARSLDVASLAPLVDVDTIDDALLVAAGIPASRFARALQARLAEHEEVFA